MINPLNEEYRTHILNVLKEVVTNYPDLDGLMLDRVRYDGITADFSSLSREKFEEYIDKKVTKFPEDIFVWKKNAGGKYIMQPGKFFQKWIEWRTKNITDFMALARKEVKATNPKVSFGTYTGAWYPSYYEYFGNSPVSVSYRLVSNKGSTLLSQIQMFSPLFVHLQNIH